MRSLGYLVRRNTKLFFRDKGLFFTSMVTPLILILLFVTFLGNVYHDSFASIIPQGIEVADSVADGFVGGWLFSSLLAVCCVTVAFCSNMVMVQDRATGTRGDLTITPVKSSVLSISYYISTALTTAIICFVALGISFIYLANTGWYLSASDVIFIIVDVFLLVLFGTALSSVVCHFLSSQGQMSAVSGIVSAAYGFLCGAYMPIAQFSDTIRNVISFLPGTYGTALLHNHLMGGALRQLEDDGVPQELVDALKDNFDLNLVVFDNKIEMSTMYLILGGSIVVLIVAYVLLNKFNGKRKK